MTPVAACTLHSPARESAALRGYYGLGTSPTKPVTLREMAEQAGVTRERSRQGVKAALARLIEATGAYRRPAEGRR